MMSTVFEKKNYNSMEFTLIIYTANYFHLLSLSLYTALPKKPEIPLKFQITAT